MRSAAKHRSEAQPAARRPEAQRRDTPKKQNLSCKLICNSKCANANICIPKLLL
ncbi:MAG: hypothetical protein NZ455_10960 [Bacteroidia bacterium]|nr:hypothetical protein [Bacteroidia bacterium]